jgi:hypothetical protein
MGDVSTGEIGRFSGPNARPSAAATSGTRVASRDERGREQSQPPTKKGLTPVKTIAKLSVVGLVLVTSGVASAAVARRAVVSGLVCQATSGSVSRNQWGVNNPSTSSSASVLCPLTLTVRDNDGPYAASYLSSTGTNCDFASRLRPTVTIYDRNSTEDVSCTLFYLHHDGTIMGSATVKSTGYSSDYKILTFPAPDWLMSYQSLVVRCNIPPTQSGIGSSHVTAFNVQWCDQT